MPLSLYFFRGLRVLTANGDLERILEGGVEIYEGDGLDRSNKSESGPGAVIFCPSLERVEGV